jgi:hypothetical protein
VYFNIRLEGGRQCILVLMGATGDGKKELIAVQDGQGESEQSWKELLLDVQARGLTIAPKLAIGDGALGFWKAVRQVWSETAEQRCWVHKTANVLDKLPKSVQPKAKGMLHEIYLAPSRAEAEKAFDLFVRTYEAKYPKATACLAKDRPGAVTVLRLPGGALEAPADDERDRERVRNGAAADGEDEGVRDAGRVPDEGVQADAIGIATLASLERFGAAGRRGQGDGVRG